VESIPRNNFRKHTPPELNRYFLDYEKVNFGDETKEMTACH